MYKYVLQKSISYFRGSSFWLSMRHRVRWKVVNGVSKPTIYPKDGPPYNLKVYKGSNQVALTRNFTEFYMTSEIVKDIIVWFADTQAPDEYIWPSINHNPHLNPPGGYTGRSEWKIT